MLWVRYGKRAVVKVACGDAAVVSQVCGRAESQGAAAGLYKQGRVRQVGSSSLSPNP